MTQARATSSLWMPQDDRMLQREWRFERIGWGVIALVLAAGFAGVFGGGRVSRASAVSADGGATLDYERIIRHGAPTDLALHLAAAAGGDTVAVVALDEEYLGKVHVDQITPEPLAVRASGGRVEYHLLRPDPSRPMTIAFSVQPGAIGRRRATLTTSHGALALRQFVLP